jgi:cystathionine gamma-synthase
LKFETLSVHPFERGPQEGMRAVVDAISMSTIFERHPNGEYPEGFSYTRAANPNRSQVEEALAKLEGGTAAAAFSSGSAATTAVFQALEAGDHVICTKGFYGTKNILEEVFKPWGLTFTWMDTNNVLAVEAAMKPNTRLIWAETPTNPMMLVTDIFGVSEVAHKHGALALFDNTLASPVIQRPLELGADLVMHSTTKYLGGHSDVLGGAVIARENSEFFQRVRRIQSVTGAVPSPFECWLLVRGIRTLALRARTQSANAQKIAEFLAGHPRVEKVLYAGLTSHPGHDIAAKQMYGGFGGLMSFLVKGDDKDALGMTSHLQVITRATSLGAVETTVDHRYSVEPPGTPTPKNLLRLSVGIEHVDDLIADLDQALGKM